MVYMLLFLIFSVFVASPINLLYTVANPGRDLLNILRISDHNAVKAAAKAGAGSRKTDRAETCAKDVGSLRCLQGRFFSKTGFRT